MNSTPSPHPPPSPGERGNKCSRCGRCCREVYLPVDRVYTEDGLDHLEWAKHHRLAIAYREDANGKRLWGVELDAPCMHLRENGDGKTTCAIYDNRPQMCQDYNGGEDFPECGYYD